MAPILNLLLQIKMLGKSLNIILLTPFCWNWVERKLLGSLLDYKTSHEIWTTLLSTYEQKTNENLHELQKKFFQNVILPDQSLTDFIASLHLILHLILSDLVALSDKTFNEDTIISKLLSSPPEGLDHFCLSGKVYRALNKLYRTLNFVSLKKNSRSRNVFSMKLLLPQVLSILMLQIFVVVFLIVSLVVTLVVFRSVGEIFLLHHEACLPVVVVLLASMIVVHLDLLHDILQQS